MATDYYNLNKNYHTHTYRCKHAFGDIDDYCLAALDNGLEVLGFSDHTPFPDNKWLAIRMNIRELDEYSAAIDEARETYAGRLTVLKGLECEYRPECDEFYKSELLEKRRFDYLVLGSHFFIRNGKYVCSFGEIVDRKSLMEYTEHLISAMKTGFFDFVAHPDLFGNSYSEWDQNCIDASRMIFETAEELGIPLEINGCGIRKGLADYNGIIRFQYPLEQFWELASGYDIRVLVNSDAHMPEDIVDNMSAAAAIAEKFNLKYADMSSLEEKWK